MRAWQGRGTCDGSPAAVQRWLTCASRPSCTAAAKSAGAGLECHHNTRSRSEAMVYTDMARRPHHIVVTHGCRPGSRCAAVAAFGGGHPQRRHGRNLAAGEARPPRLGTCTSTRVCVMAQWRWHPTRRHGQVHLRALVDHEHLVLPLIGAGRTVLRELPHGAGHHTVQVASQEGLELCLAGCMDGDHIIR